MKHLPVLLGLGAAVAAMVPATAAAQTVTRDHLSHGTASCQAALPVFDGNIRKRPLAFANEGTGSAFVTCDTDSIDNGGAGFSNVGISVVNRAGAATVDVSCTLVDGVYAAIAYHPKTVSVPTGGIPGVMEWDAVEDNDGTNFLAPAISCNLPPGVDIALTQFSYPEETGIEAP